MKNIPNIISFIRILIIPVFIYLVLTGHNVAAGLTLTVSGFTDMIDGYLARKFNWITQLGKILDPIADKLTQIAVYAVLMHLLRKYWPLFMIMIIKESIMLIMGYRLMKKDISLKGAKWFGKVATTVFYVVMTAIVLFPGMSEILRDMLIAFTLLCVISAAAMYIPEYFRHLKGQD